MSAPVDWAGWIDELCDVLSPLSHGEGELAQRADGLGQFIPKLRLALGVKERAMDDPATALRDAATSLETIASLAGRKSYGNPPIETYMDTFMDVRLYAAARAKVAREALVALDAKESAC